MSRIRANNITDVTGTGAPLFPNGLSVSGVATATSFNGNATGLTGTPNITVGVVTATSSIAIGSTDVLTAINAKASTGKSIAMAMVFGY